MISERSMPPRRIMLLFFPIYLYSCINQYSDQISEVSIDKTTYDRSSASLFEGVVIHELKIPNDSNWIGKVDYAKVYDNEFFIADETQSKSITVFNEEGVFLRQLKRHGDGPGQYKQIHNFTIDRKDSLLIVYDRLKSKFFVYDLYSFNFHYSINADLYYSAIEKSPEEDTFFF